MSEDWLFNDCVKKNDLDVMVLRLLLGKKFVNLLGSAAITNIWAIIVNPLKFVDRLEGSDTHSPPLFILELGSLVSNRQLLAYYRPHKKLHRPQNLEIGSNSFWRC